MVKELNPQQAHLKRIGLFNPLVVYFDISEIPLPNSAYKYKVLMWQDVNRPEGNGVACGYIEKKFKSYKKAHFWAVRKSEKLHKKWGFYVTVRNR